MTGGVEPCWYCGAPSALLCDRTIAQVRPPALPALQLDLLGAPPAEAPAQPVTCDAAACRECARRYWTPLGIMCNRGRGRGCSTIDLCHIHGDSDWWAVATRIVDVAELERLRRLHRGSCWHLHHPSGDWARVPVHQDGAVIQLPLNPGVRFFEVVSPRGRTFTLHNGGAGRWNATTTLAGLLLERAEPNSTNT